MTSNFRKTIVLKKRCYNTKADLQVFSQLGLLLGAPLYTLLWTKNKQTPEADYAYNLKFKGAIAELSHTKFCFVLFLSQDQDCMSTIH